MKTKLILTVSLALSCSVFAQELRISDAPVFNIFELGIKQGQTIPYDEVAKNNITTSINGESGTLGMFSLKQKNHPETAYMIEIYADENAYQKHINSPQYKEFLHRSPQIIQAEHKRRITVTPQFLGDKKIVQNGETINNLVIVDVKPEFDKIFRDIVFPEMAQSLNVEDGVMAMYAVTGNGNSTRWYFYEIYASEDAYQAHRRTPHFQDYLNQTENMTTYKKTISVVPTLLMNKGGLTFVTK
ncbi:putative quinol monooxygenase [Pectobacterium versatile]|uniref:putative quinol monooxygenase n=1 Tax=Pectobacterium versatile TaxID=2488639 RepID=UPI001CCEE8B2|nr:antibiotic biosynthesis monooxygenase [Pectobacterium versatile]